MSLARTLKTAYRACDLSPFNAQKYYVDLSAVRNTKAIDEIRTILEFQEPEEYTTILFTGHRGCGKSTELTKIEQDWQNEYLVIHIEADQEIDIQDVYYTDLYLLVLKQVEYELRKLNIPFNQELLNNVENWFKTVTQETEGTVESSVSMSGTLEASSSRLPIPFIAKLLVKLNAQIKGSNKKKTTIRQVLEQDVSRLQADMNLLLQNGLKNLRSSSDQYKGFLIVFDNLDRIPPAVGERLFFDYASQLQALKCNIIYTVPVSVSYSERKITNFFANFTIVSMINMYLFDRDSTADLLYKDEALKTVASVISERVDVAEVFESTECLVELVKASGGNIRQLIKMMRSAVTLASASGRKKISSEDIIAAVKEEQFDFERVLPDEYYPALAQVYLNKKVSNDNQKIGQMIMFNTAALEYNGDRRWNYVNPVVRSIESFQQALKDAQNHGKL